MCPFSVFPRSHFLSNYHFLRLCRLNVALKFMVCPRRHRLLLLPPRGIAWPSVHGKRLCRVVCLADRLSHHLRGPMQVGCAGAVSPPDNEVDGG